MPHLDALTRLSRPQWLVVHYRREDESYGDWSLHAWGDIAPDAITRSGHDVP